MNRSPTQLPAAAALAALLVILAPNLTAQPATESPETRVAMPQTTVKPTQDFELTGDGSADAWTTTEWVELNRRPDASHDYTARFKTLYSDTGIYVLFDGTDSRLTATLPNDFDSLWTEDVYEVFLWPDETYPVYFEYEISPLNKELPILVPNLGETFMGWRPWNYDGPRKTRKKIGIRGGEQKSGSTIEGWSAEVFIPWELLKPMNNVPPRPGTVWRANVYRVDYDNDAMTQWDWARVGPSFHEYKKFGTFVFE